MRALRIISLLAVFALLAAMATLPASADASYRRGDADGNGAVEIIDATKIGYKLAGFSVDSFSEKAADVDGNGLDIVDATWIMRFLADMNNPHGIDQIVEEQVKPTIPRDEYELPFVPAH